MRARISRLEDPAELVHYPLYSHLNDKDKLAFNYCAALSHAVWVGEFDEKAACFFGIVLPSFLSEQAYLWLHVDESVIESNQFLFVRHSQRVVEKLLKDYPLIVGLTHVKATKSIRWLKWLGATFETPRGLALPFRIRRKHG